MADSLPKRRLAIEWLAILLLTALLAVWAQFSGATRRVDSALVDWIASHHASPASGEILIVTIDDGSLAALGQWPWPREKVAKLVDSIEGGGARAILLDVIYTEPSDSGGDAALAESMRRSGKVALPQGIVPATNQIDGTQAVPPIPELAEAAFATGHVAIAPDEDGTVRRIALAMPNAGTSQDHVVVAMFRRLNAHTPESSLSPQLFLRRAGSYRSVPAAAMLAGEVPKAFVEGKLVIVGATAQGLGDNFPVSSAAGLYMSGAELQANFYQNLGEDGFILPMDHTKSTAITMVAIVLLFIAFLALRPMWCAFIALILAISAITLSYGLAALGHVWFAPGPVLLALVIAHPLWGWRRLTAISDYLTLKANRLALSEMPGNRRSSDGFDSLARAVSRLDFLVDEVSERRSFLRRVVEATPNALCVFDSSGKLVMMNSRACEIAGLSSGTLEGLTADRLLTRVGGQLNEDRNELTLGNGSIFVMTRSTGRPEERWPAINLAMFTDVTDQRRAESERRHALEFLSHDMRSPQVAILGLISERNQTDDDAERIRRVRAHARRTLDLADAFVQLARLDETPLNLEAIDLAALAEEASDRAYGLAGENGARIEVETPADPLFVSADGLVLSRVLDNLIGNSIKYGAKLVLIGVARKNNRALLHVNDDGPGLPGERLANPFERFGARSGSDQGGAGLGLAFVETAIRRHEGLIACTSSPGKGTQFSIELPLLTDL